ncbi:hypothetical protein FOL47_004488 [Perkinsus chesapeaki]|uniref:mitogen-activated protein kinase kinase n=1 Tax=Perkinsus chesapeaki TaxID=330153 RepID=A0A7J6M2B1_PERCH|nr:hypothetical protein FOL47_004488 [Perkinsus chesapeaki]
MRGVGHIDGKMCIVMEHMDKGSLSDILACRGGRLPEDVLFSVAKDCCVGLDYLHNTLKLIHGDLKPANILMSSSGVAKISDFRVSSAQVAGRRECHGTLLYMSPEELRGEGGCGYLSDVWSLGLTLLECALGRFPYMAEVPKDDDKQIKERVLVDEGSVLSIDGISLADDLDFWQLMEKIDNPPSLTALQRECGFSDKFLNFIDSCLQIDPTRRDSTTALLANNRQAVNRQSRVSAENLVRPSPPGPVARYAIDGSELGGGEVTAIEVGKVMAKAVSDATLKEILSEAAKYGRTDDDLFNVLRSGNVDCPVSLRSSPLTPSTAISILEACAVKRVRSFPDLAKISAILLRPGNPRMTAEEAKTLLRVFSFMGAINEPLALACANSVIPEISQMSWHDVTTLVRDVARHRARPRELFEAIISRAVPELESIPSKDIFSLWHTVCYLRIPLKEEDCRRIAEEIVKRSASGEGGLDDIIDAAYACSMMSLGALKEEGYQHSTLGPLVWEIIKRIQGGVTDEWFMENKSAHRRLLVVRAHLRYCLRDDLYLPLGDDAKSALRRVHRIDLNANSIVEQYPDNAHPVRLPKFIMQLSQILRSRGKVGKLKVAHFVRARRGPFTFDILERDRKLVWECNHFDRFYGSSFDKLATRRLEERVIKAMGYRIVQVPFWHWRRVTLKSRRIDMIRMSRFIALRDFRERHMAKGEVDQYSDPTKFNARECALDSNSFQYIGENFFKAQKPSKAWMLSGAGLKLQKLPTRITM